MDIGRIVGTITELGAQLESLRDSFGGPLFEESELPSALTWGGEKPSLFRLRPLSHIDFPAGLLPSQDGTWGLRS